MIPMACPNCGRRGSVPPDKLNSRLHCKKCDAVFHMDASGHVVLGEPGSSERKSDSVFGMRATATKPKAVKAAKDQPMDLLGNLKEAWQGLPMAARVAVVVVAAGTALWASGVTQGVSRAFKSHPVPPSLSGRAEYLADAFIDDSTSRVRRITAPGTEGDADAWMAKVRPELKHSGARKQGNLVTVLAPVVLEENPTAKRARVLLLMMPPRPDAALAKADKGRFAPGYKADGSFALPSVWTLGEKNQWLLDGKATLENANNPPTAKDDPEPASDRRRGGSGASHTR